MKTDEPFNPNIKSTSTPKNIFLKLAEEVHIDGLCDLMAERNPLEKKEDIKMKTEREVALNVNDPNYRLFVAILENEIVGLSRFYHSKGLPVSKLKFDSPDGWYAMGTLVAKHHRRKGIARFLFKERIKVLEKINVKSLYSVVDINNLTSIKIHLEFGFLEIKRAKGFLHLDFQDSEAILFKYNLL